MGWIVEGEGLYEAHEGYAAFVTADGQTSGTSSTVGVTTQMGRTSAQDTVVPWWQVVGWQTMCVCGWVGKRWERSSTRSVQHEGALDADDARGYHAEDAEILVPIADSGTTVAAAAYTDWKTHVDPLAAAAPPERLAGELTAVLDDVATLADDRPLAALVLLRQAAGRVDALTHAAARAARANGATWEQIGQTLGVSRQAAAERFSRTTERTFQ